MVIPEDKDNEKINDLQNLNIEHCVSSVSRFIQPQAPQAHNAIYISII